VQHVQLALERPFPVERLHFRCGARTKDKTKGIPLAYIDARDAMRRLDEVVGFDGWQNKYSLADNGLLICDIGLFINGRWVWKSNGAGDTQVEAEKGKASDAFKRAAVMWGIGRYLYSLPNEWLPIDQYGKFTVKPAVPSWATPEGWDKVMLGRMGGWSEGLLASVQEIKRLIAADDLPGAGQVWAELDENERSRVWLAPTKNGPFTTEERDTILNKLRKAHYGDAK